ncbi:SusC/RagA family TonB-linked outer membrane protein [Pedobacter cryophilus]|uniref:TonB-dependent receptor n=1 Tax=Pedobacter cryophilus TaxID=2571271 RepID=A0A4U1C505_9SPHI|nr:TonB-dependent receptor [Pedobacter cryophilus]TKC00345.1 TonB-dependent receptor [Pedobacter cryophilus]
MKKLVQILFTLLFIASTAIAQDRTITGTVTAKDDGTPLPGVSITIKGNKVGTQTNLDGRYSIQVPLNSSELVFSYVGFISKTAIIKGSTVNVVLESDSRALSEVVVTGYGTQKRDEFTGSSAKVSGDVLKDRPIQSFGQGLTGQAAGVNIIQPNGVLNNPPVIRVRGFNSISLSSFPLIVVDGIPIVSGDVSPNNAANNTLGDINPSDIESIDILKDAASTSIYGSRGAAGVLIITTKKGKQGQAKVNLDSWFGITNPTRLPDILNASEYIAYKNEAVLNSKISGGNAANPAVASALFFPINNPDGSIVDTRWYDEVYREAYSQNHSLSISGATDKTTYYFSAGLSDQDGFIKRNNFKRNTARFNVNQKVTDWLKFVGNINITNSKNEAPNTGSLPGQAFGTSGLGRLAVLTAPNVYAVNPDGSYNISSANLVGQGNNLSQSGFTNAAAILDLNTFTSESNRILATVGTTINLVKGLTLTSNYSVDKITTESISFSSPVHGDGFTVQGEAANYLGNRNNWNWSSSLNYNKTFATKHNVDALVGYEAQEFTTRNWGGLRQQVADPFFNDYQGNYTLNQPPVGNAIGQRAFAAVFTRLNYNYGGKYFVTANLRRDGNSTLAAGRKYGNFGGVSAGWLISEEGFFKNSKLSDNISKIRIKGSYGVVGNGNLPSDFGSNFLFGSGLYGASSTLVFAQAGNTELQWETSKQTNIGLDLGFLNDRISFEATYFKNNIDGLILDAPQSPSKGIPGNTILQNIGSMYNQGIELGINASILEKGKFKWNANINYTNVKNEVTSLATGNADIAGVTSLETANITRVGYSVGSINAVKTAGINPDNGRRIFINKAGQMVQYQHVNLTGQSRWTFMDGSIAPAITLADAQIQGSAIPKWYGGFNNNFSYGRLDLGLQFTYSGGNVIYNGSQAGLRDQRFWNNQTDVLRRWTTPGQITDIPRPIFGDNVSNGSAFPIDANVEDGDFLRLSNATLGYKLPTNLLTKAKIGSVRIYASVNNAFLITNYTGSDPETSTNGNSNLAPGVERNSVPQGRTFTFGLNVGF